jgi:hypothetical protein
MDFLKLIIIILLKIKINWIIKTFNINIKIKILEANNKILKTIIMIKTIFLILIKIWHLLQTINYNNEKIIDFKNLFYKLKIL